MKASWVAFAMSLALLAGAVSHTSARAPVNVNDAAVLDGMPRNLSEFGFFADLPGQKGAERVVAYSLNTPLYSDGAAKRRFIYLPEGAQLRENGEELLDFPVGSAIIKTFDFEIEGEVRLIETRVLLHRPDGWVALPYKWNSEQTDARLALAGARLPVSLADGTEISYRVPNKNQCKTCHSKDGKVIPIGPKARNMSALWLAMMEETGMLNWAPSTTDSDNLPVWGKRYLSSDENVARAYLDVNCAHCHQPGGSASNSGLDLRWEQDDPHAIGIRKPPVAAGRGSGGRMVSIAPGDPDASILLYRMKSTEPGIAMPELGKGTVDREGVEAVHAWIEGMPAS